MSLRRPWFVAVVALAGAAVLLAWLPQRWRDRVDAGRGAPDIATLVRAIGSEHGLEARLTGGFAFGPARPSGGTRGSLTQQKLSLLAAAGELQKAARQRPERPVLHAWGVAQLLLGDYDEAVVTLSRALQPTATSYASAPVQSDLAAAYLARAAVRESAEDLPRALAYAERATRDDPALLESRFNAALVFEKLGLPGAGNAWLAYAQLETQPEWAAEARRRSGALAGGSAAPARRAPRVAAEELIGEWADAHLQGHTTEAASLLVTATQAAESAANAGDRMPREALVRVRQHLLDGGAQTLARAFVQYREAWRALRAQGPGPASAIMGQAEAGFVRSRCDYALWGAIFRSIAARVENEPARALTILAGQPVPGPDWPRARGRYFWTRGMAHEFNGDLARARADMREAVAAFRRSDEPDELSSALSLLAEIEGSLGNEASVWSLLSEALGLARANGVNPWRVLLYAANFAMLDQLPEVAVHFEAEAVRALDEVPDLSLRADAYRQQAETLTSIQEPARALERLAVAERTAQQIGDAGVRAKSLADIALARAQALLGTDPGTVEASAVPAIAFFGANDLPEQLALAHTTVARSKRALADVRGAADAYERALQAHERDRTGLEGLTFVEGMSAYRESRHVVSEYASLLLGTAGSDVHVLEALDAARGRTILAALAGGAPRASLPGRLAALPPGVSVLYFAQLEQGIIGWRLTRAGATRFRAVIPVADVDQQLGELARLVDAGAGLADAAPVLKALFDLLVAPADLEPSERLIVIPDASLWRVPFAALVGPNGTPLLTQAAVSVAPSLAVALQAARRLEGFTAGSVAAVGDGHDPRRTGLPALPGANREAASVAAAYPQARLFLGAEATADRVLRPGAEVLHFAGHAVLDDRVPWASRLLVAPSGAVGDEGTLTAMEIASVRNDTTKVVVLAACEAASGLALEGEGAASVASMYLVAGVPAVVAPLWPVSGSASELLLTFHRLLRSHRDPAAALRAAQVEAIGRTPQMPLRDWASYMVLGGFSLRRAGDSR